MDNVIQEFLSMSTLVLCLLIGVFVLIERKAVEYFWKSNKSNRFWTELGLPSLPLLTGGLIGLFAAKYPYPELFSHSVSGRVFFSMVCGLLSAHVYRVVKKFWQARESGDVEVDLKDLE